eukprot:CAMPEP_0197691226 /NCGR_PEP_ID=MMETSP1338-20131121/109421_1 /TAXON_ID=43686 ORGANISM="Pelagodinium beii, Strain RCC1491" /NCGR_SAMPLE_ID=MMETSP1338 /ASSEMBLY_ACC=CAM_ASM_000754 /LENGTH=116 /DNA_ID=CAMNT_0043273749 /DNA_START=135 /DNA_END=482 /DNA_ORIENTATION=+
MTLSPSPSPSPIPHKGDAESEDGGKLRSFSDSGSDSEDGLKPSALSTSQPQRGMVPVRALSFDESSDSSDESASPAGRSARGVEAASPGRRARSSSGDDSISDIEVQSAGDLGGSS